MNQLFIVIPQIIALFLTAALSGVAFLWSMITRHQDAEIFKRITFWNVVASIVFAVLSIVFGFGIIWEFIR